MAKRTSRASRGSASKAKTKLWAWSLLILIGLLGLVQLWFGLAYVLRCERSLDNRRVDLVVERRFMGLGFLTFKTERVPDIVSVVAREVTESRKGKGGGTRVIIMDVKTRQGNTWTLRPGTPSFGSHPKDMAPKIDAFIKNTAEPSLTQWRFPWLLNLGGLVFLSLPLFTFGEVALRTLGVIKDAESKDAGPA